MEIRLLHGAERFEACLIATVAFHGRMEDPGKSRQEADFIRLKKYYFRNNIRIY